MADVLFSEELCLRQGQEFKGYKGVLRANGSLTFEKEKNGKIVEAFALAHGSSLFALSLFHTVHFILANRLVIIHVHLLSPSLLPLFLSTRLSFLFLLCLSIGIVILTCLAHFHSYRNLIQQARQSTVPCVLLGGGFHG